MKLLIIEDEAPKRTHLQKFLQAAFSDAQVRVAKSVTSALDALESIVPDILLLDMSLPTFDISDGEGGGRPQGFGGIEILRHMALSKISCPTIVITGYEAFPTKSGRPADLAQMRKELEAEFPFLICGVLHYNSTIDEWKNELSLILVSLGLHDRRTL